MTEREVCSKCRAAHNWWEIDAEQTAWICPAIERQYDHIEGTQPPPRCEYKFEFAVAIGTVNVDKKKKEDAS
jgi:hypothetical protein